jgi:hypothetical protein
MKFDHVQAGGSQMMMEFADFYFKAGQEKEKQIHDTFCNGDLVKEQARKEVLNDKDLKILIVLLDRIDRAELFDVDNQELGWRQSLDNFKRKLETLKKKESK